MMLKFSQKPMLWTKMLHIVNILYEKKKRKKIIYLFKFKNILLQILIKFTVMCQAITPTTWP